MCCQGHDIELPSPEQVEEDISAAANVLAAPEVSNCRYQDVMSLSSSATADEAVTVHIDQVTAVAAWVAWVVHSDTITLPMVQVYHIMRCWTLVLTMLCGLHDS